MKNDQLNSNDKTLLGLKKRTPSNKPKEERILETIRLTVSRMRFSFDLLDRGFFIRPHKGLSSGSCWSFFMGYPPVQQSLQEYLGVLVHDPVEPR